MRKCSKYQGFTLIELLVVIGIIVLLAGLLLPIAIRAIGAGEETRMRADLLTIGTALDAYQQDNGRYPAVDTPGTGFAVLGQALISPGPALIVQNTDTNNPPVSAGVLLSTALTSVEPGAVGRNGTAPANVFVAVSNAATVGNFGDNTNWKPFGQFVDGVEGYGSSKGSDGRLTQDPYLAADSFKTNGSAILDYNSQPILYYPARAKKPNLYQDAPLPQGFIDAANSSLFDTRDNTLLNAVQFAVLMGDLDTNGRLGAGEEATAEGNFVLISPGTDLIYLTATVGDVDANRKALDETDDIVHGG